MISSPFMSKEPLIKILKDEVQFCKKNKQKVLYMNWLYKDSRLNFFDTHKEFLKQGVQIYVDQGFEWIPKQSRPHLAKKIGAKAVFIHIFRHPNYHEDMPPEPLSAMFGEYINAHNEFCIYEVIC
jgi:hypothetical protein